MSMPRSLWLVALLLLAPAATLAAGLDQSQRGAFFSTVLGTQPKSSSTARAQYCQVRDSPPPPLSLYATLER